MKSSILSFLILVSSVSYSFACPYIHQSSRAKNVNTTFFEHSNDPLIEINNLLKSTYNANKQEMLNITMSNTPIIVVNNKLTLYISKNNQLITYESLPLDTLFTQLKLGSHIALITYVLLQPSLLFPSSTDVYPILPSNFQQIQLLYTLLTSNITFTNRNLTNQQMKRQIFIQQQCIHLIENILQNNNETKTITLNQIHQWSDSIHDSLTQNMYDATKSMLDNIHHQMMIWKQDVLSNNKVWKNLKIIVLGESHMARHNEHRMQYFSRLLQTSIYSHERVIYAEGDEIKDNGFPLLSTHLIDFSIGQSFFNNPSYMHSDILAPAAHEYLNELLSEYPDINSNASAECISFSNSLLIILIVSSMIGGILIGCAIMYWLIRRKDNTTNVLLHSPLMMNSTQLHSNASLDSELNKPFLSNDIYEPKHHYTVNEYSAKHEQ